jgi:hypothetical protein
MDSSWSLAMTKGSANGSQKTKHPGGIRMKNTTIAIDLAKSVFEIGISDRPGHIARNHRLSRTELAAFVAAPPPATVVMEACSSAHYWGRKFEGFGTM